MTHATARELAELALRYAPSGSTTALLARDVLSLLAALDAAQQERDEAVTLRRSTFDGIDRLNVLLARAEAAVAAQREALRGVSNAYGCFAGCTGSLPGAPADGHTPACLAARVAVAETDTPAKCICTRFSDLPEGTIIADLTCPIHGVNGTDPGDVLPPEMPAGSPAETETT